MSPTDVGFTTSSRETRKAAARSEAAANQHVQRDRSTLYGGLCTNCENLENCTYPSTTSDTWFCEEHLVAQPPKQPLQSDNLYHVDEAPDAHAGLCVNCEVRATCTLSKPAGGVWFCNEYE
jgi:hypothetical protein